MSSNIAGASAGGIPVSGLGPVLRGVDLIAEAATMEPEFVDVGHGVTVERRGCVVKLHGGENMGFRAMAAALQASEAGGTAARRMFDSWLSTHPGMAGEGQPTSHSGSEDPITIDDGGTLDTSDTQAPRVIQAGLLAAIIAGAGNDHIDADAGADIDGGDGDNWVRTAADGRVVTGSGHDLITVGLASTVEAGAGDDLIKAGANSEIRGGAGNDRIEVEGGAVLHYALGDGDDIVGGGRAGFAFEETDRLRSSVLNFGPGIAPSDLGFRRDGNNLVIDVAGNGSITLTDVQRHGTPTLHFADGTTMGSADLDAMAGPAEEYRPASMVLQRWRDASAAYLTTEARAGQ